MSRPKYPKIEFDRLKLFFGEPYEIDLPDTIGKITVYSPTIGDIVEIGENRFLPTRDLLISNTTLHRVFLWDVGLDWNEITDFQLFCLLYKQMDPEACRLFFGDVDWTTFEVMVRKDGSMELDSEKENIQITEDVYQHLHQCVQNIFQMWPEDKITDSKFLKEQWIRSDRVIAKHNAQKKKKEPKASLVSQISSYINHPGTKRSLDELKKVGVYEFFDSLQRLQIYEHSTALLKGSYSGMVDTSKIDKSAMDWMREIA